MKAKTAGLLSMVPHRPLPIPASTMRRGSTTSLVSAPDTRPAPRALMNRYGMETKVFTRSYLTMSPGSSSNR